MIRVFEVRWVFKLKQFTKKLGFQAGGKPRMSPVSLMSACSGMLTEGLVLEEGLQNVRWRIMYALHAVYVFGSIFAVLVLAAGQL